MVYVGGMSGVQSNFCDASELEVRWVLVESRRMLRVSAGMVVGVGCAVFQALSLTWSIHESLRKRVNICDSATSEIVEHSVNSEAGA